MQNTESKSDLGNRIWHVFSSMFFGVVLILVLSGVLALATVVSPDAKSFNVYDSLWFRLIIGLLCMNLLICSVNRIGTLINYTSPKPSLIKKKSIDQMPLNFCMTINSLAMDVDKQVTDFFSSHRYRVKKVQEGEESFFYITKGNLAPWFSLLLHLSLVVIVVGFIWGGYAGYETKLSIPKGYSGDLSQAEGLDEKFSIRLDEFVTVYDDSGNVSNWVSKVTLLSEGGDVLRRGEVKVNHPLNYKGINLYQYSYGQALDFRFTRGDGSVEQSMVLSQDQYYHGLSQLGAKGLWVGRFQSGELPYKLSEGQQGIAEGYLQSGDNVEIPGGGSLKLAGTVPFSVIEVKKDPSVPLVFWGLLLMAVAFFGTMFISQKRYWAKIVPSSNGSAQLLLGGLKGRRDSAEEDFNLLTGMLESKLDIKAREGK